MKSTLYTAQATVSLYSIITVKKDAVLAWLGSNASRVVKYK